MKTQIINKITEDLSDSVSDAVSKKVTEKTFWKRKEEDWQYGHKIRIYLLTVNSKS